MDTVLFFATPEEFRAWLDEHAAHEKEVLVGFYKVKSGRPSMVWSQAVDQALCYGWIDGVRRSIDAISYYNRFTPRRKGSNWSKINIDKVEALKAAGLMQPAGLAAYEARDKTRAHFYSFEQNQSPAFGPEEETTFKKNPQAREFFAKQAPSYQRLMIHWVMSGKRPETRASRLQKTIDASARGVRL